MRVSFQVVTAALLAYDNGFLSVLPEGDNDWVGGEFVEGFTAVMAALGWTPQEYAAVACDNFKLSYFGLCQV